MDSKSLSHVKWKCQVSFANFYYNSVYSKVSEEGQAEESRKEDSKSTAL